MQSYKSGQLIYNSDTVLATSTAILFKYLTLFTKNIFEVDTCHIC